MGLRIYIIILGVAVNVIGIHPNHMNAYGLRIAQEKGKNGFSIVIIVCIFAANFKERGSASAFLLFIGGQFSTAENARPGCWSFVFNERMETLEPCRVISIKKGDWAGR